MQLSNDQAQALEEIRDWYYNTDDLTYTLKGAAGTGKTTLVKYLLEVFKNERCIACAPTHKAKNVLADKIAIDAFTHHGFLGYAPYIDLNSVTDFSGFRRRRNTTADNIDIIFNDEASMLSKALKDEIESVAQKSNTRVLYIGDEFQLPPINEATSPALDVNKYSSLNEVIRQKGGNPLLILLVALRLDIMYYEKSYTLATVISDLYQLIEDTFKTELDNGKINFDLIKKAISNGCIFSYIARNIPKCVNAIGEGYEILTKKDDVRETILKYPHTKLLAFTNKMVSGYNTAYRKHHGLTGVYNIGETLMAYASVAINDIPTLFNGTDYAIIGKSTRTQKGIRLYDLYLSSEYDGSTNYFSILDERDYNLYAQQYVKTFRKAKQTSRWKLLEDFRNEILLPEDLASYYKEAPSFCFDPETLEQYVYLNQFPKAAIKYGYALTVHKSQGSTYERVLIAYDDIALPATKNFKNGRVTYLKLMYVALSRASKFAYIHKAK